jgi:hypothetical protein
MKNIYLIPTNKPSRFSLNSSDKYHLTNQLYTNSPNFTNQNIYITNDSEIKKGDWVYSEARDTLFKVESKAETTAGTILIEDDAIMTLEINEADCKKIILTTDKDLIQDGVQSIDDNFLKWFVKNPSCETVEVEAFCKHGDNCPSKGAYDKQYLCDVGYKIIMPSKELINPFELPDDVFNKSLEEDAEKEYPKLIVENPSCNGYNEPNHIDINEECRNAFMEGAKWQEKKMYSEEDMREAIIFGSYGMYGFEFGKEGQTDNQINKYLKQLKKK